MSVALQSVELDVPGLGPRLMLDVWRDSLVLIGRESEQRRLGIDNPGIVVVCMGRR